jgi:drug/metabolite transporter (DMT)-like permease
MRSVPRFGPYLVLAVGVAVVSTASILIRYAQGEGVPSIVIAAVRLGLAAIILTPLAAAKCMRELRALDRRNVLLMLASGAFLAIHFWAWIASLEFTSVASSVVLVTTNPLWVGLASIVLLRERLARGTLAGIALTLAGCLCIFAADSASHEVSRNPDPLRGNALALLGAAAASGYLLMGRVVRRHVSLLSYIWLAYGTAAVLLLLAVAATQEALSGYSLLAYAAMLGLAVGPQLLCHTAFNWALRYMSATLVALSILGEPVGSAALAWLFFDERFKALQLAGFVLLLLGIYLAARAEAPAPAVGGIEGANSDASGKDDALKPGSSRAS